MLEPLDLQMATMVGFVVVYDNPWLLTNWPLLYCITFRLHFQHEYIFTEQCLWQFCSYRTSQLLISIGTISKLNHSGEYGQFNDYPTNGRAVWDQANCHEFSKKLDIQRNPIISKWSLNVMQYKRGQFVGNHGLSYTITNLTMVAIWRSSGFRIHPLIAEKKTTLLFQGTFGHTVGDEWWLDVW